MSRRLPNHQRRVTPPENNRYQVTSLPVSRPAYSHHAPRCGRKLGVSQHAAIDIGFSDATTTDTCYDYCDQTDFQHSPLRESRNTDVTFSDDSGSTRLPYFEFDDESNKVYSRNSFSDRSYNKPPRHHYSGDKVVQNPGKTYPEHEEQWEERLYHEIQTPCDYVPATAFNTRRMPASRLSDRPQSSMSSAVTTAMVYGCGGKCQTFESICYFVLQLVFTMGILIGVSLCIAGLVLRKSAARNLQVLVYIGIILALVSTLLLTVQCRAKNTAKRRIKAIQMAKRAPIQMDTLHVRSNPLQQVVEQQQLQIADIRESQRQKQMPQIHKTVSRPLPQRPQNRHSPVLEEQPGIPWWRRRDLRT